MTGNLTPQHTTFLREAAVSDMMPYNGTCQTPYRHTGEIQVQCHSVLTLALDVGQWPASLHGRFIPTEQEGGCIAHLQK